MNQNSSDTQSAELPANAEQTEPADLAPDGDEAQAAPEVAPEVEQPAAEIPPAGTEESVDVTPTTDATPATDAEPTAAEATTNDEPTTEAAQPEASEAPADEAEQPAAEAAQPAAEAEQPAAEAAQPEASEAPVAEAEQPAAEAAQPEASEAPAAEAEQPAADAEQPAASETPAAQAEQPAAPVPSPEDPPPGAGPKIIGRAEDVTPPPVPPVKQSLRDLERQQRPRRRRLNATQRHRNVFFARLNEFRRQAQPRTDHEAEMEAAEVKAAEAAEAATDAPAAEASTEVPEQAAPVTDAGAAQAAADGEATTDAPAGAEAPVTDAGEAPAAAPAAEQADQDEHSGEPGQKRRSTPPPPIDRPRLVAAIERAGGPEVVMEALQPKRDENDQPLKWATVCADACKGLKPSDPVFSAWVRLAATPVSAIKRELGINDRPDRGRGRGPRRGGRDDRGPRRGRDRDDRGGVSREEFQRLARGGSVGANIRIIGLNDEQDEKQEREARRKAEREAKRQAERERLARLGY